MRSFIIVIIIYILTFSTSCQKRCNGNDFKFRVRIEINTEGVENIELKYSTKHSEIQSLTQSIIGGVENQFYEFCLEEEPVDLKFILKGNFKNKEFYILSLLLENQGHQMFIQNNELFYSYFVASKNIVYDKQKKVYKIMESNDLTFKARKVLRTRLKKRLQL